MVVPVGRDNRAVGSHHSQTHTPGRQGKMEVCPLGGRGPNKTLRLGRHGRGHKGQHGRTILPGSLLNRNRMLRGRVANLSTSNGQPLNLSRTLDGRLPKPSIQVLNLHSKALHGRTRNPSKLEVEVGPATTPGVASGHCGGVKVGRRTTVLNSGRSLVWKLGQDSHGDSKVVREEAGSNGATTTSRPVGRQVRLLSPCMTLCCYIVERRLSACVVSRETVVCMCC